MHLVSRVGNWLTVRFRDDGVGVLGPGERFAALIPAVDEAADGIDEFADGVEAAAADGLAGDDAEASQAASPRGQQGATANSRAAGSTPNTSSSDKSLPGPAGTDPTTPNEDRLD